MQTDIFTPCDILLPAEGIDMSRWAVIACDQHTSEPEYWERVREYAGGSPSTLNMMVPENMYRSPDIDELINGTHRMMDSYIGGGIFKTVADSYIIVERELFSGKTRCGIVGAVDLERYDASPNAETAVRSTEAVVPERLPLRIKLREGASLDIPHILLMTDEKLVFDKALLSELELLYDFELMEGGGHIRGYRLPGSLGAHVPSFSLLLAGDGNHSVASAKACWEKLKPTLTETERETHPCRFTLAEVVSIHDASMEFEPIHRVVFGCNPELLLGAIRSQLPGGEEIGFSYNGSAGLVKVPSLGALQVFLDEYPEKSHIDYIHGDDVAVKLARQPGCLAIVLPAIDKNSFFDTVKRDGVFPRKAFSIGTARDKRYYLECRKIV